ncbi:SusC/RagA family TonB-linked outer membrane protein [Dysgonomonas sp. ZJ279]|uniref:SusC/RagA family TonB-linked outer membrane protein n=1 Tax=Dysgonomonas sp. ZJ279 TaxID=2709796 RepID=UPI0013EA0B0F|nr:SusC/RagA family TonB-linked outer membrane protein [Dysgonomonas sp. ZJ279]
MEMKKHLFHMRKNCLGKVCLILFLLAGSVNLYAQNQKINISGIIKDETGVPLIGANVTEKGTTNGTMTDVEGNFSLSVNNRGTIQISFVGYIAQEMPVNGKSTFDIILKEDSRILDEVIVVGYGSTVKKDLTTAVTSVSSKDFLQGAVNSPMQMIDGKVAGLSISNPAAADPNKNADIQIRGASSMKAGNSPLIVIDGMPGGDLRNLAQQDIESITVLKDGSAAAIYGSRAANGVILVQTKQGKAGKVSITYDSFIEHDAVAKRPEILSAEEFVAKGRAKDWGARTDWYNELLNKNNFGQNHNISLAGGSESSIFRISANYRTKEGLDIATNREEYGLRASFKQTTLEGLLEVGGNVSYRIAEEDWTDYAVFKQAVKLNPTVDKNEMNYFTGRYDEYNPIKWLTERERGASWEYATIDFNIKLNLAKNLNTELQLGRQGINKKQREYYTKNHKESIDNNRGGRARFEHESWVDWTLEWIANYAFKVNQHDFKIMGGYSYQEFNREKLIAENADFPSDAFTYNQLQAGAWNKIAGRLGMESEKDKEKTTAFLGRVNYNFDNQFLVTASLRYEGNSKFGTDNKWGYFPAASAAWRFSRLPVFENTTFVDDLKVRFSYGQTGRSGFDKYIALSKYSPASYSYVDGKWIQVYGPGNNPNANLKWEKQISYNLGLDYTLFNSKLSGSIDVFIRDGQDVIGDYTSPVPPYIYSTLVTNVGTTRDKGIELQLNWNAVKTKDFSYSTALTASYINSKIKSFSSGTFTKGYVDSEGLPSPGNPGAPQRLADGKEIGSFYGYRYAGVDADGKILIYEGGKKSGNTVLAEQAKDSDKAYLGNGSPDYELAWSHSLAYKEFDLNFFFRGKFGFQILNTYQMYYGLVAEPEVNLLQSAYNDNAHIKGGKVICDYFLEDGSYFKLDNISLGWTPKIKSKFISNLRLYGTVRNVFTITKYSGLDPTTVPTAGLWPGISSLDVYPIARNFSFGVQISY